MPFTQQAVEELLTAMDERATLARHLMNKLLLETNQPKIAETEAGNYDSIQNCEIEILSDNWYYDVHGEHCLFINRITNQKLEVSLGTDSSLENLDPYFFYDFLATTDKLKHLTGLFESPFNDMLSLFLKLEKQGILNRIYGIEFRKLSIRPTADS